VTERYRIFSTALATIEHEYSVEVDSSELVYGAIDGMLRTLDPHSSFLEPQAYAQMRERQEGVYYGLGLTIAKVNDDITVINLFEGTPAYRSGIRRGDVPEYGVMGYFGMGMYLNYVARRPNVGTPLAQLPWHDEAIRDTFRFQFAGREDDALRILERRRIRYVVTIPFYLFLKNGAAILGLDADRWLRDTRAYEEEKVSSRFDFRAPYFGLVDSRLLLLDGSESEIRGERIPALGRFRLVHECSQPLNRSNFGDWSFDLPGDLRYCKIYEVVRGARIRGRTLPYGKARLSVDVLVGNARRFTYRSSARADASGLFAFTVPYATQGAGPEEVRAGGPYRIQTGDGQVFSIEVPAVAVTKGRAIEARS
jgi:asparagine N-glycosylation enzyme membrane subunit Stt3